MCVCNEFFVCINESQREAAGAGDDTLRLSVGLESLDDLILDLEEALRCI